MPLEFEVRIYKGKRNSREKAEDKRIAVWLWKASGLKA
jgi:hypothetical protein